MLPPINREISAVLKRRSVSSSANLAGFVIDARHFLEEAGPFASVEVRKTGDPHCAILITCSVADPSLPLTEIAAALERIWLKELAYFGGSERHKTEMKQDRIEMTFMSEADPENLFVTGRIVVSAS
jgi:hypothetical protein